MSTADKLVYFLTVVLKQFTPNYGNKEPPVQTQDGPEVSLNGSYGQIGVVQWNSKKVYNIIFKKD